MQYVFWVLVFILALTILLICFKYLKESRKSELIKDADPQTDEPINFGYKLAWIAVKTDQQEKVAKILGLKNSSPSNWQNGIENAYRKSVFITPSIGEWTLAIGWGLIKQGSLSELESIERTENLLNSLSLEFGEAHFYCTHRVVEYHSWIKSIKGQVYRSYSYVGESGETIRVFGKPEAPEDALCLYNSESNEQDSFEFDYANEELVMEMANAWSIDPTRLSERTDIKRELGLIGN